MPRGGVLVRGMGGTTLDDSGQPVQTQSETIQLPDDGVRRKIIKLPNEIEDPGTGRYADNYLFHHYFEIFRNGKRELTPLYTEEIVTKEVEYVDYQGNLGGMCIYWSIYDWNLFNRCRCRITTAFQVVDVGHGCCLSKITPYPADARAPTAKTGRPQRFIGAATA
jgi:hypothetical protein